MPSVCIRTILFTPIGKSEAENKYIEIYMLWLSQVIKRAELTSDDVIELCIDPVTLNKLKTYGFEHLHTGLTCKMIIITLPQPSTLTEGCMWKYLIIDYTQDIFFYCDIDIFILKPIHHLIDTMKENTIYAHAEAFLLDKDTGTNYSADFPPSTLEVLPEKSLGYSAGKFFIYGKTMRNNFFEYIQILYSKQPTEYLMLEQPFYNRALYELNSEFTLNISLLTQTTICINNHNYNKDTTILYDFCGMPGDNTLHLTKAIYIISLLNAGIY